MFINDAYGYSTISNMTVSDTRALYRDINRLLAEHGQLLSQNNLLRDVEILKEIIERSMEGSVSAAFYLRRHGVHILTLIKEKMMAVNMRNATGTMLAAA